MLFIVSLPYPAAIPGLPGNRLDDPPSSNPAAYAIA
jgi:hypothetical protein